MGQFSWKAFIFVMMIGVLGERAQAQVGRTVFALQRPDVQEVVVKAPPAPLPSFQDRLVGNKLSKEFSQRYEEKFGRQEEKRGYYELYVASNRHSYYGPVGGGSKSAAAEDADRRAFGTYMFRRLAEYHADKYLKNEPSLRPVVQAKERLSSADVQVSRAVKVKAQYQISGNHLDVNVQNPWVESRLRMQLGSASEQTLTIARSLNSTVSAETFYKFQYGLLGVVGRKQLTSALSTSLVTSTETKEHNNLPRETRCVGGIHYIF